MTATSGVIAADQRCLHIGGDWVTPTDGRLVEVINPTSEETIASAALAGPADIDRAVRAARTAFDHGPWARSTPVERAAVMRKAAQLISERAELFAQTVTLEVGSPAPIAQWQPLAAKLYWEWY